METYHKINTLFKRDMANKGAMIHGEWSTPELEYLSLNEWEFTEKVDGTNIRIGLDTDENLRTRVIFNGRSDNAVIPDPLMAQLQKIFTLRTFEDAGLSGITLFGEGYGPKIQGGGKYRDDHSFVLFDAKIEGWWLKRDAVEDIANKLDIEYVPLIGVGTLYDAIDLVQKGLTSQWGDFEAEGLVCRPAVSLFDRAGNRIITKIKAKDFKS